MDEWIVRETRMPMIRSLFMLFARGPGAGFDRELRDAGLADDIEHLDGYAEAGAFVTRDQDAGVVGLPLVIGDAGLDLVHVDELLVEENGAIARYLDGGDVRGRGAR